MSVKGAGLIVERAPPREGFARTPVGPSTKAARSFQVEGASVVGSVLAG